MNGNNQIPSQELKLPESGYTVVISTKLTIGQSRILQSILFESSKFNAVENKVEETNPATFMKMQDRAAEFLIQEVKTPEGEKQPFTMEWLSNLSVTDGDTIYREVNNAVSGSSLSAEGQKKS